MAREANKDRSDLMNPNNDAYWDELGGSMNKVGFPTLGAVLKLLIKAVGINFGEYSCLSKKYSEIELRSLRRRLDASEKETTLDMKSVKSLVEQILIPAVDIIYDKVDFSEISSGGIKSLLEDKVKSELHFLPIFIMEHYKNIVLNIECKKYSQKITEMHLGIYFTSKMGVFSNFILKSSLFKFIESDNEIKDWLKNGFENHEKLFETVLDWWVSESGSSSLQDLSNKIEPGEAYYKTLKNWRDNNNLPELERIILLLEIPEEATNANNKNFRVNLVLRLMVVRFIRFLLQDKPDEIVHILNSHYMESFSDTSSFSLDPLRKILTSVYVAESIFNTYRGFSEAPYIPYEQSLEKARVYLTDYKEDGNREKVISNYRKAFNEAKYVVGIELKTIIEEILSVSAFLDDKKLLKEVYSWAKEFGLFNDSYEVVEKWARWFYKFFFFKFFNLFNFDSRKYKEIIDGHEYIKKYNIFDSNNKVHRWGDESVLDTPNELNHLDSYFYLSFTQLMRFCISGNEDKARKAISNGARIDISNEDNATALHYALKFGHFKIALNLLETGKFKKIDALTYKDRMSVFDNLIEGLNDQNKDFAIDLLKKIIEKGFNVNMISTEYESTPFYTMLKLVAKYEQPDLQWLKSRPTFVDIAVRDFNTIKKSGTMFLEENKQQLADDIYTQNSLFAKKFKTLEGVYNDLFKVLLRNPNTDMNIKSGSGFSPLLYAARVADSESFKEIYSRTDDCLYIKDGEFEEYQSILGDCILGKKWSSLEYYLSNESIEDIIDNDFYLPIYTGFLLEAFLDDPNELIEEIIFKMGSYFHFVSGYLVSGTGKNKSVKIIAVEMSDMWEDFLGKSKILTREESDLLLRSLKGVENE